MDGCTPQNISSSQAALEQRQRRAMQLRHLHELQASNDQRRERQQAAEQRLSGLQVRAGCSK